MKPLTQRVSCPFPQTSLNLCWSYHSTTMEQDEGVHKEMGKIKQQKIPQNMLEQLLP